MPIIGTVQLGKNGVTENFVETLKTYFKNYSNVRISVLKGGTRDKKDLKEMTEKILNGLGKNFTARTIGFTIIVKKWRREMR